MLKKSLKNQMNSGTWSQGLVLVHLMQKIKFYKEEMEAMAVLVVVVVVLHYR